MCADKKHTKENMKRTAVFILSYKRVIKLTKILRNSADNIIWPDLKMCSLATNIAPQITNYV